MAEPRSNFGYETGSLAEIQAARDRVAIEQMRRQQQERRGTTAAKPREQLPDKIPQPTQDVFNPAQGREKKPASLSPREKQLEKEERFAKAVVKELLKTHSVEEATEEVQRKLKETSEDMRMITAEKPIKPEQVKLQDAKLKERFRMVTRYEDQLAILKRMANETSEPAPLT